MDTTQLFAKGKRFAASISKVAVKMAKPTGQPDALPRRMIVMGFDIPLTNTMREQLPTSIVSVFPKNEEEECEVSKLLLKQLSMMAHIALFNKSNYRPNSKPVKTAKDALVTNASMGWKKNVGVVMTLQAEIDYIDELWVILGNEYDEEMVVEIIPLQGNLFADDPKREREAAAKEAESKTPGNDAYGNSMETPSLDD